MSIFYMGQALKSDATHKNPFLVEGVEWIYTNAWKIAVWVAKHNNGTSEAVSFQLEDEKGNVTDPILKKTSQLNGKNGFNFLLDLPGGFVRSDIDSIKTKFREVESKLKSATCLDRVPFDEICETLCTQEEVPDIITKDEEEGVTYLNISMEQFKSIVDGGEWGWKPLEVKKRLQLLGLLRVNTGRAYDYAVRDKDGTTYRTISIKLSKLGGEQV